MRLDHIAYRTKSRTHTAKFFMDTLGYKIQQEFAIPFDDGTTAQCIALEPPEKIRNDVMWVGSETYYFTQDGQTQEHLQEYHMPPEIFISDGPIGSIVGDWVAARNGIGGIHHIAYQVSNVEKVMKEWQQKGYEFSSDKPMKCPEDNLVQIFTKPIEVMGGITIEFIERGNQGFCTSNVKALMNSSKGL